jgi:hypothetical protein
MILASRLRMVASDDDIAAPTNDQASLQSGLDPNATRCLTHWGFHMEYPQTYTEEGIARLAQMRGPLWVACDVRFAGASRSCPHIRVITGVRTLQSPTMLMVNDPGPVGVGSVYEESYAEFIRKNELLGSGELRQPSPIYIAYLA